MSSNLTKFFNVCKAVGKYSAIGGAVAGGSFGVICGYQDTLINEYKKDGKVTSTERIIPCENKYIRSLLGGIVAGTVSGAVTGTVGLLFPVTAATTAFGIYNGNIYKEDGKLIIKTKNTTTSMGLNIGYNK